MESSYPREERFDCPDCKATGDDRTASFHGCAICNGKGYLTSTYYLCECQVCGYEFESIWNDDDICDICAEEGTS